MKKEFQSLIAAIIRNDAASAKALVKKDPSLAANLVEKAFFEPGIVHWIYVGDTALHVASAAYQLEIAKALLDAGADPGSAKNMRRSQPLHYAADGNIDSPLWSPGRQTAVIRLLIQAGADVQARDKNGATALHRAVRTRCAEAVKTLLEAGADPALKNLPGSTPFHLAVQNTGRGGSGSEKAKAAQCEIISAFLERGIRPTLKDGRGKSVLDWAGSGWIREILLR
jgi:Ankyrin repeats (3 copies)